MEYESILTKGAEEYGIKLNNEQIEQFIKYMKLLKEWNEKINLTAITEDEQIIKKHFIDSISIIKSGVIDEEASVIDVGTGAGFPGIPLKIIMPHTNITLLDSLNKRVSFLNTVISELKLNKITAIHGRAEEASKTPLFREKFDIATARAVANMNLLSEYCLPYVKKDGYFIAMKGPSGYEEVNEAKNAINVLGGKVGEVIETNIPGEELRHNIIIVKKVTNTPSKYPRRFAIIEKNPIK